MLHKLYCGQHGVQYMKTTKDDLAGIKFGRFTAQTSIPGSRPHWRCLCECGTIKDVYASELIRGKVRSCGCMAKDQLRKISNGNKRKYSRSNFKRERSSWENMIDRCHNEKSVGFKNYGAKGVYVCERWRDSFENFLKDMGPRPSEKTLDRIDPHQGYFPENCRWSTRKEQANNRKNNRLLTYKGKTQTISQWSDETGVKWHTIRTRLNLGWPLEKVLSI